MREGPTASQAAKEQEKVHQYLNRVYEQFIIAAEKQLLTCLKKHLGEQKEKAEKVKERVAVLSDRQSWLVRFSIAPAASAEDEELVT